MIRSYSNSSADEGIATPKSSGSSTSRKSYFILSPKFSRVDKLTLSPIRTGVKSSILSESSISATSSTDNIPETGFNALPRSSALSLGNFSPTRKTILEKLRSFSVESSDEGEESERVKQLEVILEKAPNRNEIVVVALRNHLPSVALSIRFMSTYFDWKREEDKQNKAFKLKKIIDLFFTKGSAFAIVLPKHLHRNLLDHRRNSLVAVKSHILAQLIEIPIVAQFVEELLLSEQLTIHEEEEE